MDSAKSIVKELLICVNEHDVKHINELLLKDTAYAFALAECIKEDYVTGIHVSKTANNSFVFQELENCSLTSKGLNFLQNS